MTRDWKHMRTVLDRVLTVWVKFPDLRLGQLLNAGKNVSETPNADIFYVEDNILMDGLERFADQHDTSNQNKIPSGSRSDNASRSSQSST